MTINRNRNLTDKNPKAMMRRQLIVKVDAWPAEVIDWADWLLKVRIAVKVGDAEIPLRTLQPKDCSARRLRRSAREMSALQATGTRSEGASSLGRSCATSFFRSFRIPTTRHRSPGVGGVTTG
jgi:hypothetical protein